MLGAELVGMVPFPDYEQDRARPVSTVERSFTDAQLRMADKIDGEDRGYAVVLREPQGYVTLKFHRCQHCGKVGGVAFCTSNNPTNPYGRVCLDCGRHLGNATTGRNAEKAMLKRKRKTGRQF